MFDPRTTGLTVPRIPQTSRLARPTQVGLSCAVRQPSLVLEQLFGACLFRKRLRSDLGPVVFPKQMVSAHPNTRIPACRPYCFLARPNVPRVIQIRKGKTGSTMSSCSVSARGAQTVLSLFVILGALVPGMWAQADVQGTWSTLPYLMPTNAVHAALLYNGKVLIIAGSKMTDGTPSMEAALWDPQAGKITTQSTSWYMFCNGMIALADGRVLVDGGTTQIHPFLGSQQAAIYDPATNTFNNTQSMAHGRWYPTVTMLSDGRIMTFSGLNETTGATNNAVEFYTVGSGWSPQYTASWTPPLYPRMHLLPNGNIFYSGSSATSRMFNPSTKVWTTVANTKSGTLRTYGSSVLLSLTPANNYDPRVMILGGGVPTAIATTEIIDLGARSPAWQWGPDMSEARVEMDAVLLPTGKVLALAGSSTDEDAATASLNADLYDPDTNSFSSAGANAYPRMYHTVSLLMPDATVWLAGSNPSTGVYEGRMEIYKPAYLFTRDGSNNVVPATRPTIASAPSGITWNAQFAVSTPDAANISTAVLMRLGSSTHAFDMDERLVGMSFTAGSGTLNMTAPPNSNIAPPGYYMLFLINNKGVPSVASFVLLNGSGSAPAPTVTSVSPNSGSTAGGTGVTITGTNFVSGATVKFGGTSATNVAVASSTSITAKTPGQTAGAVTVVVTNSDGQNGTLNNGYTYTNPAPTVTSILPSTGTVSGGTPVTITGTGFLAGAAVSLGGTAATGVNVVSGTSITATTAAHAAGAVSVVVTNSDAQNGTLSNGYTYVAGTAPPPTVTSLNPNTGPTAGGNGLTITGTGFQAGATVSLGGTAATGVTVASSTSIVATAPAHAAGAVDVVITNPDGQSGTLPGGYSYSAAEGSLGLSVAQGDPNSATVAAGKTASYTLAIGGQGMGGTASLTCTGAPVGANCSVPGSQAFNATSATPFAIQITTTARTTAALTRPDSTLASATRVSPTSASWLWTIALGMLFLPGTGGLKGSARRYRRYLWLAPLTLLLFAVSCGGGGMSSAPPQPNGTPAGTYTVIVHASSGNNAGSTSLTLIVQ
jgi:Domain of unknown function (DUF1929)/IPT/TIG domain